MNPVKVFPIKFQSNDTQQQSTQSTSNSPVMKRKPGQPSERNHTINMSPVNPVLTPSKSRQTMKRYTTMANPQQDEKIRIITQKKLQLLQPSSYSPKKRVPSTNETSNFHFKQVLQQQGQQEVRKYLSDQASSPTKLPNLKRSESGSGPNEIMQKIDLSLAQKRNKRTDTNGDGTPNTSKQQLLKLYQESSPMVRQTNSRAKVGSQTIDQETQGRTRMPQQAIVLHGRSTSQAALVQHDQEENIDIVQLFLSKSQAGQNGNRQTKTNQDSVIVQNNFQGFKNRYLFSVCDGHGVFGHYVSQLVKRVLPTIIDSQLKQLVGKQEGDLGEELYTEVVRGFQTSFGKMTKDLANCGIDITFSGCTCVTVLVSGANLWCANIGDSRAIFVGQASSGRWSVTELSNDHKPDLPSEKKRILACKGRVQPFVTENGQNIGPARVWLHHEQIPGLAMSRSFGDYVASTVGVISEPEVLYHRMDCKTGFLVVASDGIWEFISNEEIQKILLQHWTPQMNAKKIDEIADFLVREATKRWQEEDEVVDDISIILAYLQRP